MRAKRSFDERASPYPLPGGAGVPDSRGREGWAKLRLPDSVWRYVTLLGLLVLVTYAIDRLNIELDRLPGVLARMGHTLASRYFPPNLAHVTQPDYLRSVLETLQMSYLASAIGIALAVP